MPVPALDPATAEALAVAGLLTLGGFVVVPRAVVCIGAGAALGWAALLPAMAGSVLGATLAFLLARHVLGGPIRRLVARWPRVDAVLRAVADEGWRVLALLRFASPIPGPAINLACGVSGIGLADYVGATVLGLLPQTAAFILLGRAGGDALGGGSLLRPDLLFGALGLVVTAAVLLRLKRAAARRLARSATGAEATPG